MARRLCRARDEATRRCKQEPGMRILINSELRTQRMPSRTSSTIFADPGETPCLFAMQRLFSSPPSVTQMQRVWDQRTTQKGAPLTFELGEDTVSLHDLRTCCNWLALYVLALLETPLKLVPPLGFLLQLLVDFIPVPVKSSDAILPPCL
jgi:hypothetical protein